MVLPTFTSGQKDFCAQCRPGDHLVAGATSTRSGPFRGLDLQVELHGCSYHRVVPKHWRWQSTYKAGPLRQPTDAMGSPNTLGIASVVSGLDSLVRNWSGQCIDALARKWNRSRALTVNRQG